MRALQYLVVMKGELSKKTKLSIFKTAFVSIFTYGHEDWIMTEKRFLRRIEDVSL